MAKSIESTDYYIDGLKSGNKYILAKTITLSESTNEDKKKLAVSIYNKAFELAKQKNTFRIAITGSPGAGKSSLINVLGNSFIEAGYKIAVLAVDPSSQNTYGSILGDKTRMYELSLQENAYIRPSPSGSHLGGIHKKTKESILLCEAAGYDIILVETVGVGQSEIEVANLTDITILVLQPGAGDDLQGIKRGIMEIADIIVVNKSDGELLSSAHNTLRYYQEAIKYYPQKYKGIDIKTLSCSSINHTGVDELRDASIALWKTLVEYNIITKLRIDQEIKSFENNLGTFAIEFMMKNSVIKEILTKIREDLKCEKINYIQAINRLHDWDGSK